jgi:hypothetical protein
MAVTGATQKLIASGAWVQVKIKVDGVLKALGLAQGCSYDEDWGVQPANCLNHLGPISYDSQNYSCNINMSAFVPEKKASLLTSGDGGETTFADLLPTRDDIQVDGKGKVFEQLVFINTATGEVLNQFEQVILASNGTQVSPNSYVTSNMRFQAVKRSI